MQIDTLSIVIAIISAITAFISAIFAWRTVKVAEKSNAASHVAELHGLYRSESNFHATQIVWDLYREFSGKKKADGTPITEKCASDVLKINKRSKKWKAIHDAWVYWSYLNLLLNKGFLDESLAMSGTFGSVQILGFLHPVEKAFVEKQGMTYEYGESLCRLYDRWKNYKAKR